MKKKYVIKTSKRLTYLIRLKIKNVQYKLSIENSKSNYVGRYNVDIAHDGNRMSKEDIAFFNKKQIIGCIVTCSQFFILT